MCSPIAHRPDWVVVMIGTNDLNHYLCNPGSSELATPRAYAEIFDQLLALTRRELPDVGLLVVGPFVASGDATDGSYRAKLLAALPDYVLAARNAAQRHHARFLDLHAAVLALLKEMPPDACDPAADELFVVRPLDGCRSRHHGGRATPVSASKSPCTASTLRSAADGFTVL